MENEVEQDFNTKLMINMSHPVLLNQDIYCESIMWIKNDSGKGEWKCLKQKRNGVDSLFKIPEERERISEESIKYLIYLPCNCSDHESCPYVPNVKVG